MITFFQPCTALMPYIHRYWYLDAPSPLPAILPGTGAELIFYTEKPGSNLIMHRYQPFTFPPGQHLNIISIRFRHTALRHFCRIPAVTLIDQQLTARDLWGQTGHILEMRLSTIRDLATQIQLLNHFLHGQLQHQIQFPWLDRSLDLLYYQSFTNQTLDYALTSSEVSVRHFQKTIKQYTGVSPKYFQRTARFQHTLRQLLQTGPQYYLDTALKQGYYDQAHFIHEFRQFSGQAPSDYLRNKYFKVPYYCHAHAQTA